MKNYIITLTVIGLALTTNMTLPKQDDNSKTANICQGEIENCSVGDVVVKSATVGKAGDLLTFTTTGVKVQPLGRITAKRQVDIDMTAGGKKIVTFTPTEGRLKEQQIKILFNAFELDNMPKGLSNPNIYQEAIDGKKEYPWAVTMLKVYRSTGKQWAELIASFSDDPFNKMKPIATEIFPDGRAKIYSPAHKDGQGNTVPASVMTTDLAKAF
ncbi:MAG: hypothetical protein AB7F19_04815 [Candidatus Babeliales bacterium]